MRFIYLWLMLIFYQFIGIKACMRTSAVEPEITTTTASVSTSTTSSTSTSTTSTTTTTSSACTCPAGSSPLFIPTGTPASTLTVQNQNPTGTCSNPGTCTPSGTLSCYNGMCTNPITPDQVTTSACFSYSVMSTTCTNFCACNAKGVCYTPTGNPPVDTYRLISACDASGCCQGIFFMSANDNAGLTGTDGSTFTAIMQLNLNTGMFFPVTCDGTSPYPLVNAISCSGCSAIQPMFTCTGTIASTG